ncbi:uncharacterized protein LOC130294568 isoform X2 [Hyla sarda]|uniref:uncharacterized protein LOC130294568 isoform X2 n=1 Tax=Hyla sarda TaxID=327740 RepID=UPI0024C34859|nr:uncharacterized protein LOC130294568 isoform X2 [Hyla sarda]
MSYDNSAAAGVMTCSSGVEISHLSVIEDYTMDSGSRKLYHVHGFDSRQLLEHYLSDKPEMVFEEDSLKFPIENLKKTFTEATCVHESYLAPKTPLPGTAHVISHTVTSYRTKKRM